MKLMRIGVDLAKNVFQIHGVDRHEQPVWRQRLPRDRWLQTVLEKIEPGCEIGMESCGGAHHWARQLQARGFHVRLIAPQFVKPYVKSNKNDANDAEAICEAMSRPSMRFVAVKTIEQQDIQATHRIRAGLIEQRAAKANQIRGLVAEYGKCWLEDAENDLMARFRRLLNGLWDDLRTLDERVNELDSEISAIAASEPTAVRLQQLRGVGPMIATALVAAIGDASQFANGRQLAASLGLTPKQHSSGSKDRLPGISKRGDAYLRTLMVHGARSALRTAKSKDDRLSQWAVRLAERSHPNVAAIALANKTARMAWAMLRNGTDYQPDRAAA
ncbi:IS110 family transposase [Pseudomonas sp. FP1742]|uniref:IS110 family transposase n=1 Tax=Pseudomonas sp. FP1742 TaxID=2954079 RepID=UPI002736C922|nr:IS110 family transposase [Pseudomonas sp. FP1742]WLG48649.1 IS110 family transposase [Pseudomonas sp. FP1742]